MEIKDVRIGMVAEGRMPFELYGLSPTKRQGDLWCEIQTPTPKRLIISK
jgi:hypothetical protein